MPFRRPPPLREWPRWFTKHLRYDAEDGWVGTGGSQAPVILFAPLAVVLGGALLVYGVIRVVERDPAAVWLLPLGVLFAWMGVVTGRAWVAVLRRRRARRARG